MSFPTRLVLAFAVWCVFVIPFFRFIMTTLVILVMISSTACQAPVNNPALSPAQVCESLYSDFCSHCFADDFEGCQVELHKQGVCVGDVSLDVNLLDQCQMAMDNIHCDAIRPDVPQVCKYAVSTPVNRSK